MIFRWSRFFLPSVFALVAGCDAGREQTTKCVYSVEEISKLEAAASSNDRVALRELELCYDFQGKEAERQRIHAIRLRLQEPEALDEEAMKLLIESRQQTDPESKSGMLKNALNLAEQSARIEGKDPDAQDLTIAAIKDEIERNRLIVQ